MQAIEIDERSTKTMVCRLFGGVCYLIAQLYTWRQQLLTLPGSVLTAAPRFASVELDLPQLASPDPAPPKTTVPTAPPVARPEGLIEIQLSGGVLLRVDAHVDGRALRRVLGALSDR
jgi:hypothetical protein